MVILSLKFDFSQFILLVGNNVCSRLFGGMESSSCRFSLVALAILRSKRLARWCAGPWVASGFWSYWKGAGRREMGQCLWREVVWRFSREVGVSQHSAMGNLWPCSSSSSAVPLAAHPGTAQWNSEEKWRQGEGCCSHYHSMCLYLEKLTWWGVGGRAHVPLPECCDVLCPAGQLCSESLGLPKERAWVCCLGSSLGCVLVRTETPTGCRSCCGCWDPMALTSIHLIRRLFRQWQGKVWPKCHGQGWFGVNKVGVLAQKKNYGVRLWRGRRQVLWPSFFFLLFFFPVKHIYMPCMLVIVLALFTSVRSN